MPRVALLGTLLVLAAMNKRERVAAALRGAPVDRVPWSCWGHDYVREWTAAGLAAATLERYRAFDWDYIKVNPRATYFVEDWGCRFQPDGWSRPQVVSYTVHNAQDWAALRPLDIGAGALGQQLEALRAIAAGTGGEVPLVQTIFTPLAIALDLVGGDGDRLKAHLADAPDLLRRGLATIAASFASYASACLEAGASGIFLATTAVGSRDALDEVAYEEFGRPYDLQVLRAVGDASFNVLHVCRRNNLLDLLRDYPVQAFSWDATDPSNPTLEEGRRLTGKAVMGGISQRTVLQTGPTAAVQAEVTDALAQTGGIGCLLAPGCSIPPETPADHLIAARQARDAWLRV